MRYKTAFVFFLFIIYSPLSAQDGVQENTFLTNSVVTQVGPLDEVIRGAVIQPDGKIIVAGIYDVNYAGNWDIALVRYNTNGTPDTDFGTDGIVRTQISGGYDDITGVALQSDGKIVVTGPRPSGSYVIRYTDRGLPDGSFGSSGVTLFSGETSGGIAFQAGGKILICGIKSTGAECAFALFRFNSDGTPDTGFGSGGIITLSPASGSYFARDMTLDSDSNILIAGYYKAASENSQIAVARFSPDGIPDAGFGSAGVGMTPHPLGPFPSAEHPFTSIYGTKIALQSDGKILVAGYGGDAEGIPTNVIARFTASGSLDATFGTPGTGGVAVTDFASESFGIKIQADNKIIIAGSGIDPYYTPCMTIHRYNADGTIDGSFGTGGMVTNKVSSISSEAIYVELQSDGKIILAGHSATFENSSPYSLGRDFTIARFSSSGSPDNSFPANNIKAGFFPRRDDIAKSLIIQPDDGSMIAAGYFFNEACGSYDFCITRFSSSGIPDISFNNNRFATGIFWNYEEYGQSAALQADKKIVVAGYMNNDVNNNDFEIMRFNPDGTQDWGFNGDGGYVWSSMTHFGFGADEAYGVAIQPDDQKIVAAGSAFNGTNKDFALARYNTDGSPDNGLSGEGSSFDSNPEDSFGTEGKVTTGFGTGDDAANCIAIQSDGKIIAAGYSYNGTNKDFALARYTSTGELDGSFGSGGKVVTSFGPGDDIITCIALQADNKIVAAGYSYNGSNMDFALARYSTDGSLDVTFDTDGKVTTDFSSGDDYAYSIAAQSNGKIIVAGSAVNGTKTDFALARYLSTGALDNTTFGTGGKTTTSVGYKDDRIYSLAIQSDNKIVAAGPTFNGQKNDIAIVRYTGGTDLLPVELTDFNAKAVNNSVELSWTTATEVNNYGFEVERQKSESRIQNSESRIQNSEWEKIGFVKGHGNSNSQNAYFFKDENPPAGKLQYRLKQIDNDGAYKYYDALAVEVSGPGEYKLMQNSPNPFNPVTAIKFQIPVKSRVSIKVYNLLGSEVAVLTDEEKPSGSHIVYWNGRDSKGQMVSSGVYLYKLTAGNFTETRKMSLLK